MRITNKNVFVLTTHKISILPPLSLVLSPQSFNAQYGDHPPPCQVLKYCNPLRTFDDKPTLPLSRLASPWGVGATGISLLPLRSFLISSAGDRVDRSWEFNS
jgi:hypothetical protein